MSLLTVRKSSSANAIPYRCRVYGLSYLSGATAGSIVLSNPTTPTGTGGDTVVTIDTPGITTSGTTGSGFIDLSCGLGAAGGLSFSTGCAVALTTTAAVTLYYVQEGV